MVALTLSIVKKLGYVIAGLVIAAAFIVASSYLFTPLLKKHKTELENLASAYLQVPVKIQDVSITWLAYQPAIRLEHVTVLDQETKQPALQVKQIEIAVSPTRSLWHFTFIPGAILLKGTNLNILALEKGEFKIQGFPALGGGVSDLQQTEAKIREVVGWLSRQPQLLLQDINIYYTGLTGDKRFVTLDNLRLENGYQHYINGKAILHQNVPTELIVSVKWRGDETDLSKLHARIYLYVTGIDAAQWLKSKTWQGWEIDKGVLSSKIWATWDNNTFQKIETEFTAYQIDLFSSTDKSHHIIKRLSGNVDWKRDNGNGYIIAGDDIFVDLPNHLWPVTNFYLSLKPDAEGRLLPKLITAEYINLEDVQRFLFSSPPLLPEALHKQLIALKLTGALVNSKISFPEFPNDFNKMAINTSFDHLGFAKQPGYPGITNFSGNVQWSDNKGSLKLNTNRASINYDDIFSKPLAIDQLTGDLALTKDNDAQWTLTINSAQLFNGDIAANVAGSFIIPNDKPPIANITGNFTLQKADRVIHYLPLKVFDKNLVTWLEQAFLSGEVKSGHVEVQGDLANFPFGNNNGKFLISGDIKNVDFHFAPHWPNIKQLNGKITFLNRGIDIAVDSGRILDIPFKQVKADIADLSQDPILQVTTQTIQTDFPSANRFIQASPLQSILGKLFADMEVSSPLSLQLALTVPLSNPGNTQVKGDVTLHNNLIDLVSWGLKITHVNGVIQFTEKGAQAKSIQGLLFNKPLELTLNTQQKNNSSIVTAHFTHRVNVNDMQEWLKLPISTYVKGDTDVEGDINISPDAPVQILLKSSLTGVSIDLPDPYGKKADKVVDVVTEILVDDKQPLRLRVQYGNDLGAAIILNKQKEKMKLTAASLQLGGGVPEWPQGDGLYIVGKFDKLDWDEIKHYIGEGNASSSMNTGDLTLSNVSVDAKTLNLGGINLSQVSIEATPAQNAWNISINSPDVNGQIQVPETFSRQGKITADFQRINLHSSGNANNSKNVDFDITTLPAISITANNVSYDNMRFGQLTFDAAPSGNGLAIRAFNINSQHGSLQATGDWNQAQTHLRGSANSSRVSELLNSLGFDASNFVSRKGSLTFDLSWQGAPFAPSLNNLNGKATLDLGPGRIVDIGKESGAKMGLGRMLSIFSLQTIPRRLSLDFSDVFQQGYSFDYVKGDFIFQNGNANTNNLRFAGPVAGIAINGRIGLQAQDYNLNISVTPYVTSSIPVAAALINPYVGLAALAVNTVMSSQVSKATTYYYTVTGPWNNPVWQTVGAPTRQ